MINKFLIFFFLLSGSLLAETNKPELLKSLEKINNLHRAISKEQADWREEKKTLELQLQLIKESLKDQSANKYEIQKILAEVKKKKQTLVVKSDSMAKSLKQLEETVFESSNSMLAKINPALPESLKVLVKEEADELSKLLSEKDKNVMDLLSASREYFSSVLELQKKVHLTKEIVEINGEKQQVTALYVGTFIGYYITQDKKLSGQLIYDGSWKAKENNNLSGSIEKAISQFNREGKPELVDLPVLRRGK